MDASSGISTLPFLPLVFLIEILSKLPAKTLARFRCVSKFFYSLTRDPLFANMHRNLALTLPSRASILIAIGRQTPRTADVRTFYTINFSEVNQGKLQANRIRFLDNKTLQKDRLGSSSDGLICQSRNNGDITICNISMRQCISLPRIQPDCSSTCALLGFDSSTKRYKVLMSAKISDDPDTKFNYKNWDDNNTKFMYKHWVFTLGVDESWREINSPYFSQFYPYDASFPYYSNHSVYISGVIYSYNCLSKCSSVPNFEIGAFEVGAEILSAIPFPDEFSEPPSDGQQYDYLDFLQRNSALLEVDGRLAMVLVRRPSFMYADKLYMDVWTWEEAKEWKKLTICIPSLGSPIINKDCLLRFTTNSAGEIVILFVHSEHFSILVCDFKSEVWRKIDVSGVEEFPIISLWKVSMYNIVDNVFSLE